MRFRHFAFWVFLFPAFLCSPARGQTLYLDEQFDFERTSAVPFASKPVGNPPSDTFLRLELFQPTGSGVPSARPAVILIHGGGFVAGSRNEPALLEMCERMARRGWTCASIDYRLSGVDPVIDPAFVLIELGAQAVGFPHPTAVAAATEDGWAAHQWMLTNSVVLGVDPARIAVGGTSAGAGTALLMAYVLDKIGVAPPRSFGAVFDMWGSLGIDPALITSSDAPLLIAHGDLDSVVPVADALALQARAIEVGLPHEVHIVPGAGHGFDIFTQAVAPGETMFDRFVAFFYQHVALEEVAPPSVPAVSPVAAFVLALCLLVAGGGLIGLRRSVY